MVWIYVDTWECLHFSNAIPETLLHKNVIYLVVFPVSWPLPYVQISFFVLKQQIHYHQIVLSADVDEHRLSRFFYSPKDPLPTMLLKYPITMAFTWPPALSQVSTGFALIFTNINLSLHLCHTLNNIISQNYCNTLFSAWVQHCVISQHYFAFSRPPHFTQNVRFSSVLALRNILMLHIPMSKLISLLVVFLEAVFPRNLNMRVVN